MKKLGILLVPLAAASAAIGCSAGDDATSGSGGSGTGSSGSGGSIPIGTGGSIPIDEKPPNNYGLKTGVILTPECEKDCEDFPADPIVEGVSDAEKAALDATPSGAGPCVSEPANGTVFPAGWTRPRFAFSGSGSAYRITLSAPREKNTLTIYTKTIPYYVPKEIWEGMSKSIYNEDITYSVRVFSGSGAPTETTGTFQIAPAAAGGSMVFWGSTGTKAGEQTNALYGFGVGDEGVIRVLYPGDIAGTAVADNGTMRTLENDEDGHSTCVGCHSSTPDGKAVASLDHWPWNVRLYSIEPGSQGEPPSYLTGAGAAMLSMTWLGGTTFSSADWNVGKYRMITNWVEQDLVGPGNVWKAHNGGDLSGQATELIWMDLASTGTVPIDIARTEPADFDLTGQELSAAVAGLKGTGWDVIPRKGDTRSAVFADWSHDGSKIAYVSTDVPDDGRIGVASQVDIFTVPFGAGSGGDAVGIEGASSADFFEYYPDFSSDDALVAFNRIPKLSGQEVYFRPESNVFVIPAEGGTPTDLASNQLACAEGTAGQLYNSWAKWAPSRATDGKTSYYFLIFSTARNSPARIITEDAKDKGPASQLYMTTIVKNADGSITSSPAIYLWNQQNLIEGTADAPTITPLKTNNVTPAWDEFKIPPVPPVIVK